MKQQRRKAREFALQGLYQWKLTGYPAATIEQQLAQEKGFSSIDTQHFTGLLHGAIGEARELEQRLAPSLDRPSNELSPVEYAILLLAVYELLHYPEIPYRVVINEAVELAKSYGGTDGYKYVNGVLDKLAVKLRPTEVAARPALARPAGGQQGKG